MKDYWIKSKAYWFNLGSRERKVVLCGGILLFAIVIYQCLYVPVCFTITELREKILAQQQLLVFMEDADQRLHKNNAHIQLEKNLIALNSLEEVQKKLSQLSIDQSTIQIKQTAKGGFELHFQQVEFDKFLKFLALVLNVGAKVTQMSAISLNAQGLVEADLAFHSS